MFHTLHYFDFGKKLNGEHGGHPALRNDNAPSIYYWVRLLTRADA